MPISPLTPSGLSSPDGLAYDYKSKIDEILAAQAVVGDLDATELGYLNGVVAGTVAAGKAVVATTGKVVDELSITLLKIGGVTVDATASEIDGATGADLTAGSTTSAADSLAIPVTHAVVVKTTGADAEALSLADGAPGQILTIVLGTDGGGDGTLTPTTKTGFTSVVLADAGDNVSLIFRPTAGWMLLGTAGVAAPPVIVA